MVPFLGRCTTRCSPGGNRGLTHDHVFPPVLMAGWLLALALVQCAAAALREGRDSGVGAFCIGQETPIWGCPVFSRRASTGLWDQGDKLPTSVIQGNPNPLFIYGICLWEWSFPTALGLNDWGLPLATPSPGCFRSGRLVFCRTGGQLLAAKAAKAGRVAGRRVALGVGISWLLAVKTSRVSFHLFMWSGAQKEGYHCTRGSPEAFGSAEETQQLPLSCAAFVVR